MDDEQRRVAEAGTLLALGSPEMQDVAWSIFRYRTQEEVKRDPNGKPEAWVADMTGPLNGNELAQIVGGGTFHLYGHIPKAGGGVKLAYNRVVTLEGPRRRFDAEEPPAPTPVAAAPAPTPVQSETDRLIALMREDARERDRRFEQMMQLLMQQRTAPAPVQPTSLVEMVTAMAELDKLRGARDGDGTDKLEITRMLLEQFHQGIVMGREQEPVPAGETRDPNWMPVIEKGLELIANALKRPPMRPAPHVPPPPANGGGPARSYAAVEPDPRAAAAPAAQPPPAAQAPVSQLSHRWTTAIEALYRAMVAGKDPRDFADTLRDILMPDEVQILTLASVEQVMSADDIAPILDRYPDVREPRGQVYLGEVLAELRNPTVDDEDDEPEAELAEVGAAGEGEAAAE
jgi:hypothetical protein